MADIQISVRGFHYVNAPIREFPRRPVRFPGHGVQQILIVQVHPNVIYVEINKGIYVIAGRKNPQNTGPFVGFSSPANRLLIHEKHVQLRRLLFDSDRDRKPTESAAYDEYVRVV
jgi:hypothetical protein